MLSETGSDPSELPRGKNSTVRLDLKYEATSLGGGSRLCRKPAAYCRSLKYGGSSPSELVAEHYTTRHVAVPARRRAARHAAMPARRRARGAPSGP